MVEHVSVCLCSERLSYQHTSRSLYPPIFKFITSPMSNQNQPSLSTQTTSTTSTSSSSSPSGTVGDWFISTKTGTTQDQFEVLLSFLAEQNITPSDVQSNWTLSFQQFVVTVNSSMVSQIEQYPIVSQNKKSSSEQKKQLIGVDGRLTW